MDAEKDPGGAIRTGPDRRTFIRQMLGGAVAGSLLLAFPAAAWPDAVHGGKCSRRFALVVDSTACIGCGACCLADRLAYDVPAGRFRTWVERHVVDTAGNASIALVNSTQESAADAQPPAGTTGLVKKTVFVPKLCRMCEQPACRQVCPTGATYLTGDGFVLIDSDRCTGCGACVAACPHTARFLDPRTGTAAKCTWCYERVRQGKLPVCVGACPAQARKFRECSTIW